MKTERRIFTMDELRVAADGKRTITGHAAVFNRTSEPMWGFVEQVAPGAFSESIGADGYSESAAGAVNAAERAMGRVSKQAPPQGNKTV